MNRQNTRTLSSILSAQGLKEVDIWIAKYPQEQRQSAVMAALRIAQDENGGHLSLDIMDAVADYLEMPLIAVQEVASFYFMYEHQAVGKFKICVCNSVSCLLNGSEKLIGHLEHKLGVKVGEVTKDGRFSIKEVECLGACTGAPMLMIGNKYYENLTLEKVDQILANLR